MSWSCRRIRRILAEEVVADLDPALQADLEAHFAGCAKCAKLFREAMALDAGLLVAMEDTPLSPALPTRIGKRLGAGPTWMLIAAGMGVSLCTGFVLSELNIGIPWPTASAFEQYNGLRKQEVVIDRRQLHYYNGPFGAWRFEDATATDWEFPTTSSGNNAKYDPAVSRTGEQSLRFSHRPGGGQARLRIDLPIPKDSNMVIVAWILSPKGGSTKGKWLSVGGILRLNGAPDGHGQGVSQDIVAPNDDWQQVALNFNATTDYDSIDLVLSTMAGDAEDNSEHWYSWVDDVQFVLKLRANAGPVEFDNDKIIQTFSLPAGYSAANIDWSTIELLDKNYNTFRPIGPSERKVNGGLVTLTFRSRDASVALRDRNNPDDPSAPLQGLVRGRVRKGNFLVPFEFGISRLGS